MSKRRWMPAAGFAGLWIVAALLTPDVTYHLAPVIVAAAPAFAERGRPLFWALVGFGLAGAISLGLSLLSYLEGPSLLPVGGPLAESVVGAFAGSVVGAVFAGRMAVPN